MLRTHDEYQRWKHYLRDNPRRLLMKREHPDLLRPFFNLALGSHTYNGIGNRALLKAPAGWPSGSRAVSRPAARCRGGPLYSGGWVWLVNSQDKNVPGNDYSVLKYNEVPEQKTPEI